MRKTIDHFLCYRLGLLCLLIGGLFSMSHAQNNQKPLSAPSHPFSPLGLPSSAQFSKGLRIVPSRMQQVTSALGSAHQRGSMAAPSSKFSSAISSNSVSAPNFGGFAGTVPTFPAAHPIDVQDSSGYMVPGYHVSATVAGDFNGDGKQDVAVIQMDGSVDVLLGDGRGGFSAPVVTAGTGYFTTDSVVAVDLNGDGKQDLVGYNGDYRAILVWLSNGDGSFAAPTALSFNYQSNGATFAVADVNGDGHPDILVTNNSGQTPDAIVIQTLLNAGDGTFPAAEPIPTTTYTLPAGYVGSVFQRTANVSQIDGKLTLLFEAEQGGMYGPPYSVAVYEAVSNGNGTFTFNKSPLEIPSIQGSSFSPAFSRFGTFMLVQDLNGDGEPDILIAPGDGSIYSALGIGNGGFAVPSLVSGGIASFVPNFIVTDLDGDGIPDLLDAESGYMAVFRGKGDGTFSLVNATGAGLAGDSAGYTRALNSTAFGDFNSDGKVDYISVDNNYGSASFHAGQGGFAFAGAQRLVDTGAADQLPPAMPNQLFVQAAVDLNGDTRTDLVGFTETLGPGGYTLNILSGINQGKGVFKWTSNPSLLAALPLSIFGISPTTADFNHDGKQDLIIYGATGGGGFCLNWYAYTALSNGDGTFQPPVQIQLPNQPSCPNQLNDFAVADVNGDGNLDIIITYGMPGFWGMEGGYVPSGYYVALGDGTGRFPTVKFVPFGNSLNLAVLADFNGDGVPDLALSNFPDGTSPSLSILLNDGTGNFSSDSSKNISYSDWPVYLRAGDLDQDGKTDLVMATAGTYDWPTQPIDSSQSGLVIYPGNGDGTVGTPRVLNQGEGPVIALADFNGDGLLDIMAALSYDFNSQPPSITDPFYGASLLLNAGDGSFASPVNTYVPYGVSSLAVGNFYGDGVADLLEVDAVGASVLFNQGGSTVLLSASSPSTYQGDTVVLTARIVPGMPDRPAPTGSVTFYDGGNILSTASVDSEGTATYTTTSLSVGKHTITVSYAGDTNFNPVTSAAPLSVTVNALPPNFNLFSSSSTITIGRQRPGSLTLTLSPNATFNGTVSLTAAGVPAGVTVRFSPPTVQLGPGQSAQITATISAGNATTASLAPRWPGWMNTGVGIGFVGMLLSGIPRRRRMPHVALILVALGTVTLCGSFLACGGGSSQSAQTGTSLITITATSSVSGVAPQSTTVALTIQ